MEYEMQKERHDRQLAMTITKSIGVCVGIYGAVLFGLAIYLLDGCMAVPAAGLVVCGYLLFRCIQ